THVDNLEAMVRDAVGADSSRGDRVRVTVVPFEASPVAVAGTTAQGPPRADPIQVAERFSRPAIGLAAVVALVLVGAGAMRAMSGGAARAGAERGTVPELVGGAPEPLALRAAGREENDDPTDATARVLRAWLADS